MTNSQPLKDAPRLIAYEVRDLVTRRLHVPFDSICYRTVKQALDQHPSYSLTKYSSRTQQLKKFLKDNTSALTVKEFWQGISNVHALPTLIEVVYQVQALITTILGVPPKDICCSTVKHALDQHPAYTQDLYPSRARQTKQFLKDFDSPLCIREFWQGVYEARQFLSRAL
ncbi:MAG: hypothetical protein ACFFC7_29135 [Candidatus Hermodarchaeota archaeon]